MALGNTNKVYIFVMYLNRNDMKTKEQIIAAYDQAVLDWYYMNVPIPDSILKEYFDLKRI